MFKFREKRIFKIFKKEKEKEEGIKLPSEIADEARKDLIKCEKFTQEMKKISPEALKELTEIAKECGFKKVLIERWKSGISIFDPYPEVILMGEIPFTYYHQLRKIIPEELKEGLSGIFLFQKERFFGPAAKAEEKRAGKAGEHFRKLNELEKMRAPEDMKDMEKELIKVHRKYGRQEIDKQVLLQTLIRRWKTIDQGILAFLINHLLSEGIHEFVEDIKKTPEILRYELLRHELGEEPSSFFGFFKPEFIEK